MSRELYMERYPESNLVEELTEEEKKDEEWRTQKVDLVAFEEQVLRGKPVFTKDLLEQFAAFVKNKTNGQQTLLTDDVNGRLWWAFRPSLTYRDWYRRDFEFYYQNYCELAPDNRPERPSPTRKILLELNGDSMRHKDEHIPLPVCMLAADFKPHPGWDNDLGSFDNWRLLFNRLRELWMASSSAALLRQKFTRAAETNVKIKNIVCFGFGCLALNQQRRPDFRFWSPLQHFAALTIASTLSKVYQARDAECPAVKIVFQDPMYEPSDSIFWELSGYRDLEFVRDPHGFLAIDEHTFVMTAHLPHTVPLMQMCADLVEGGPAGFVCDKMKLDPDERMWCTMDRGSPRVVKMLLNRYTKSNFEGHVLERELWEEASDRRRYWLWKMDCLLKPKSQLDPEEIRTNPYLALQGLDINDQ
jgi:hypothetical protein